MGVCRKDAFSNTKEVYNAFGYAGRRHPAVSLCCPVLLDNNLDNKLEYFKNNVLKVVEIDGFEGKSVICGVANLPRSKWDSRSQRFDPTYLHKKPEKVKK